MKEFRVAEIFGPTIQGEGRNVGAPCHFVRFGGCDFRCTWCDTPHAVLPELVAQLPKMNAYQILHRQQELGQVEWVVITGGNPGLLNLDDFITLLQSRGYKVMVETQGSTYRPWYKLVDDLCFSPKPPSSGMQWDIGLFQRILTQTIVVQVRSTNRPYLKVPVFTDEDLEFAKQVHLTFPDLDFFISVGNDDPYLPTVGNPNPGLRDARVMNLSTRDQVLNNFGHILAQVLADPDFKDVRIFPQQHVLLWGNERGH